jgi:hypothetical protein
MREFHASLRSYLRAMGMHDALFSAAVATPFDSVRLLQRDEIVRFGIDRREFGETVWRFIEEPTPKIRKLLFARTDGDEPHYVDGMIEIGCNAPGGMYLMLLRQKLGPDADSSGAGPPAATIAVDGKQVGLSRVASASFYVRLGWMAMKRLDTVADGATIELPGSELGRKELGNVTLTLDGSSTAYAKLRPRCHEQMIDQQNVLQWRGDPRAAALVAQLPHSKQAVSDPRAAAWLSQLSQSKGAPPAAPVKTRRRHRTRVLGRSNSPGLQPQSKSLVWIFYMICSRIVPLPASSRCVSSNNRSTVRSPSRTARRSQGFRRTINAPGAMRTNRTARWFSTNPARITAARTRSPSPSPRRSRAI